MLMAKNRFNVQKIAVIDNDAIAASKYSHFLIYNTPLHFWRHRLLIQLRDTRTELPELTLLHL